MQRDGFTLIELMIVAAIIGILTAVLIPGYQQYLIKARVSNGIVLAAAAQFAVAEATSVNNTLPATQAETGYIGPSSSADLESITVANDGTAAVTITYPATVGGGGTIILTPSLDASGALRWDCKGGTLNLNYRPPICRGN